MARSADSGAALKAAQETTKKKLQDYLDADNERQKNWVYPENHPIRRASEEKFKKANEDYKAAKKNSDDLEAGSKTNKTKPTAEPEQKKPETAKLTEKGKLAPSRDAWKSKEELDKYTKEWQQRNGLDDVSQDHDRFHAAVHSYLGRSSEDFAKAQGVKGITPMEEILVNFVNQHVSAGGGARIDRRRNLIENAKDMKESFIEGGDIKPGSKQDRDWDRSAVQAARIFEVMSRRSDFGQFIDQLGKYPDPYEG